MNSSKIVVRVLSAVMALALVFGLVAMAVQALGAEESQSSLAQALSNGASFYQLTADEDGVVIERDIMLDLNGYDVTNATVAQGVTLQLIDSANDQYEADKCGSFSGTVDGTVEQLVKYNDNSYLVIETEGVYSAHRFYAGIDRISLVPDTAALGYKASFYADEVISPLVESYGYRLWANSNKVRTYTKAGTIDKNELTLRVKNILDVNNASISQIGATATIYGQATISFKVSGETVTVNGAQHDTTLRQTIETINETLGQDRSLYTDGQVEAVKALCTRFETYMTDWEKENIFAVEKFAPQTVENLVYGQTVTLGQLFAVIEGEYPIADVVVTVNGEEIDVAENWADTVLPLQAGTSVITVTDNHYCIPATITVEVAKADPEVEMLPSFTGIYGQTLAQFELPEGYAWVDPSQSVGSVGMNYFAVIYTPADPNYNSVETTVGIVVEKADPTYTVPENLTAVYGQRFEEIALPEGFYWESATSEVGNAGTSYGYVYYMPSDTENYNTINHIEVYITVAKADPVVPGIGELFAYYGDDISSIQLMDHQFTWESTGPVGDVGVHTYYVTYTPHDTMNYNIVEHVPVTVNVSPAMPVAPELPTYQAIYGQTLSAITLPEGFTWENPDYVVNEIGKQYYTAIYSVNDPNYYDLPVTVDVLVSKADPAYTIPTGLTAVYGQDVSEISLPDGFEWESVGSVGNVGENILFVTYTPADSEHYNVVTGIKVTVAVAKADPSYEIPTGLTAIYGQTLANVTLPNGFSWADSSLSVGNAGTNSFTAIYNNGNANYNTVEVTVSVAVAKANPSYTAPTGLTATYGQTLADVTLSGNWTWKDSGLSVGNVGTNSFTAVYTPDDTANYNTVEVTVSVAVAKANPTYTAPTGLTATYGQTLANVTLPSGFTWKDSGLSVGNVGTNSFTAVYTPDDTANYNAVEVTVSVAVAKANPTYTVPAGLTATEGDALSTITLEGGFAWKNDEETVSLDKSEYEATFTPDDTDNYNIVDVNIPVAVSEKVKTAVDKFAVALYEGEPAFLYRVGNANAVKLGSLFKALDGADVGTVSVEIETLGGNVSGVYTANATWTDGTIKFTGTGVVKVTISDEADDTIGNPVTITLEVIDATNVTKYSELGNKNSVLLNDITMSSGGAYYLSGATLYGNGFTFDMTDGNSSAPGYLSESYVFGMSNANLDNAKVVGAVYTSYGATVKDEYNRPAIMTTGNCTITNSYVSNCAAPIRIKDGNLEIINTTLKGGNFANLDIRGGNVVLDNVTTINQVNGNDTAADGTVVVGFGVVVYYENVLESTTITVKNGITQYNEMSKAEAEKYITDSTAKILVQKIYASENSAVQYTDSNGVIWVNAGILSMEAAVGDANITDINGYVDASPTMSNITGYLHTKVPTATSITAPVPEYVSAGQGSIAPSCSFDYETKNHVVKTDGSNDFCYYDNGTVMISMDDGDTFNWDTSILTATKLGTTLEYTVAMNGTDYTGKAIAFNQTGKYEVVYTYTDGNNYKLNASGEITTYEKTYTKTVHINVAVVMPDAKHAEFTFGSSNTASKQVTVGQDTYVMPNVSATSSTIGSTTVNGTTVYYPIVEMIMSDNKTSHTSAWYAYYPVFSGAVTITDYADAGTGSAVTYGASSTTMPGGLSLVGNASEIFKYQSASSAGASPVVKNNILVYSSPSISAKRAEYNTVVQYKYQDNAGLTYYYYIGYHAPAQSYSSICVAPETLVTMADGTQKQIQYVSVGEEVVAWNFYTGKYDVVPVSLLQTHGTDVMDVLYLSFEDGTQLKVLGEHGIYDADLNTFIFIDKDDVMDYVGHSFVQKNGDSYDTVKLVGYEVVQEYTTAYTILSTGHYNVMLENMFTVTPAHVGGNFFNPFEVGEGMKYDEAKVQADIEKYGLYTYEDFDHVLTYEQFVALNLGHFKVSAGKGLITYEGLIYLIQNFVNNEDYNQ